MDMFQLHNPHIHVYHRYVINLHLFHLIQYHDKVHLRRTNQSKTAEQRTII